MNPDEEILFIEGQRIGEQMRAAMAAFSNFWVHLEASRASVDSVAERNYLEACQVVSSTLAENQLAEASAKLRRNLEGAKQIGQHGWTITLSMAPPDIHVLSSVTEDEEADEYMLDWYERHDSNLRRTEEGLLNAAPFQNFRTAIAQCANAYRRREYAISIPCLLAVLEAGIRALAPRENFWSTRIKEVVCKMNNSAKTDEAASVWVFMWLSLFGFVTRSHASYGKTQVGSVRIFRHGVQHGTQPPADNAIEALRLFHVLASIASLHEKTSRTKLRAGSEPL